MTDTTERRQGLWRDAKTSPGWLPNSRWAPVTLVVALAAGASTRLLPNSAIGVFVILIGLSGLWVAARLTPKRLADQRYTRGPGWWIGLAISKLPLPVARGIWILMGLAITALGVATLLVH